MLDSGTGGGLATPGLLVAGGGGGGAFLNTPAGGLVVLSLIIMGPSLAGEALSSSAHGDGGGCTTRDAFPLPARPLTRFATSYFLFKAFAPFQPEATCSPCLSLKSFAVDAVFFASERETEDGSLRKRLAVLRASCFCWTDVPWVGAAGGGEVVESFEKRDWRPPNEDCWAGEG